MLGRIPRPKGEVGSGQRGILQYFSFLYPHPPVLRHLCLRGRDSRKILPLILTTR